MINFKHIVCGIGILSSLLCLFQEGNPSFKNLYVLPLSLTVASILFQKVYSLLKDSIVFNVFIIQAILRYCIIPYKMSFGDTTTGFDSPSGEIAIFIMVLEFFFVFVCFHFVAKRQYISHLNKTRNLVPVRNSIFIYGLIALLAIYIYLSGYFYRVNFVWDLGSFVQKYVVEKEEVQNTGLAAILFTPLKTITAIFLISLISSNKNISHNSKKYAYLAVIIISSLFIIGISRLSILFFVLPLLILVSFILDKKSSRKLMIMFFIFIIPVILVASIAKFTRGEQQASTESVLNTSSLNAYFAGPGNVAIGIDAYETLNIKDNILFFTNDIIQNLPGLSKYSLDLYKTNVVFNRTIYGHSFVRDQIVPLSISGLFHFGFIGSFLYAPLFLLIAFYMERKAHKEEFIGYKYVYISLSLTLSMIFMLNIGSMYFAFASCFMFIYLPFYIINNLQKLKS